MIAAFFKLGLVTRIASIAAVALALYAGYAAWRHHVYRQGYDAALADVVTANKEAADAARKAVARVRACRDAGGVWNQSTGECDRGL